MYEILNESNLKFILPNGALLQQKTSHGARRDDCRCQAPPPVSHNAMYAELFTTTAGSASGGRRNSFLSLPMRLSLRAMHAAIIKRHSGTTTLRMTLFAP